MSDLLQKIYERLPDPQSIEDLGSLINFVRDAVEVDHVSYLALSLGASVRFASSQIGTLSEDVGGWWREKSALGASSYSYDWSLRYVEQGFQRIDPVVESSIRSFMPINWKDLDWSDKGRRQLLREAVDFGVGNQGYTVPIHGPDGQFSIFVLNATMSDDRWEKLLESRKSAILVVSHFFHQKVLEITKVFGDVKAPKLSPREVDALTALALGKNRSQAAYDLKISENTFRVYVDSARHKLGALNLPHAIALGVRQGLINPT
jgi:DNA-binding CsgD family transcriptional regulator